MGYQSSGTMPNEGHKDTTGKFRVGSVNLFNYVSDQMSGKPSRKLTFVFCCLVQYYY